jgi:hypothetical protein
MTFACFGVHKQGWQHLHLQSGTEALNVLFHSGGYQWFKDYFCTLSLQVSTEIKITVTKKMQSYRQECFTGIVVLNTLYIHKPRTCQQGVLQYLPTANIIRWLKKGFSASLTNLNSHFTEKILGHWMTVHLQHITPLLILCKSTRFLCSIFVNCDCWDNY